MTGAGPGIMEAANRGALATPAPDRSASTSALPHEQYPNPYVSRRALFQLPLLRDAQAASALMRARALVAFPGGYGTLDELFEVLTLVADAQDRAGAGRSSSAKAYWRRVVDIDYLVDEGLIRSLRIAIYSGSLKQAQEEIWDGILHSASRKTTNLCRQCVDPH